MKRLIFMMLISVNAFAQVESPFKAEPLVIPRPPIVLEPKPITPYSLDTLLQSQALVLPLQPRVQIHIDARDWDNPSVQRAIEAERMRENFRIGSAAINRRYGR